MYDSAYPTIFYPPRSGLDEGVVMSMRAVNIGDAIDDFDYIKLYEDKFGREAVDKLLSTVLAEATTNPNDPIAFLRVRKEMADRIEGD